VLRSHGHRDARLLDGSRERWLDVGEWSLEHPTPLPTEYRLPAPDRRLHRSRADLLDASDRPDRIVLDVRRTSSSR